MKKPYLLLTGASSGVGNALAHYLSHRFHILALARRKDKMIESFGNNASIDVIESDLSSLAVLQNTLDSITQMYGDVLYIINCAGTNKPQAPLESLDIQSLEYAITLNAKAPMMIIKHFLPSMKKHNFGRIINVTSGAPLNCAENFGIYSGSKALLNTLSITLSKELKDTNIKLNLLSPGPVRSEMSPNATLEPDICFDMVDYLLNVGKSAIGGGFYWIQWKVPLFPDLEGVDWLNGVGNHKLERILDENTQGISKPQGQNSSNYSGGGVSRNGDERMCS